MSKKVSTKEIARKVFLRVAASKGIYQLSPEGLDIAMSCPFIDEANISLGVALACEIAAKAEDIIESGGTYTANVEMSLYNGRDLILKRLEMIEEADGFEGIYKDIQKSRDVYQSIRKAIRGGQSWITEEFLDGNMPSDASMERVILYYIKEGYLKADYPKLFKSLGRLPETARGILRDLGIQMNDSQLQVKYKQQPSKNPMRVAVLLEGSTFYEEDPLDLTREDLRPAESIPGQDFLVAKGETVFRHPFLGTQRIDDIAQKLQTLNGALNHPDDGVRSEALAWVKSPHGEKNLYSYFRSNSSPSKEIKAAARGFIKRIVKDYDNATFDEDRLQAAKQFFGKDTKMLLQKCWNKSPLKQAFGAIKLDDRMVELMLLAISKRVAPLRRSKEEIARIKPLLLTDVIAVIMVHCALNSMGVKLRPDFRSHLSL